MSDVMSAIAGGLPVVGGVISALMNNASTNAANKENQAFQVSQQDKQNSYNTSMWQQQMAYNSPSQTMSRLSAAGLNPNLVAGQVSGGYASPPPMSAHADYVAQPHPSVNFGADAANGIKAFNDTRLGTAQVSNIDAQTVNAIADATLKGHQVGLADAQAGNVQANTGLVAHQASALDSQVNKNAVETNRITALLPLEQQLTRSQINLNAADTTFKLNDNVRQAMLTSQTLKEMVVHMGQMQADTARSAADRLQIQANTELLANSKMLSDMDITMRNNGVNPHETGLGKVAQAIWFMISGRNTAGGFDKDDSGVSSDYSTKSPWANFISH
jgi:CII-binding regulator of phage lambda lysogenization HflD